MAYMTELVDKDMETLIITIPYVQEIRGNTENKYRN